MMARDHDAVKKMNCTTLFDPHWLSKTSVSHPMIPFVVFFITITILVIFLATKQRKPLDRFCLTAIFLLCVLAATSVVVLHGTNLFPASAFALAALLLAHRSIVTFPPDLDAAESVPSSCATAARDASNHSTWVVAALVAGVVSAFGV